MSVVLQKPVAKTRRRKPDGNNVINDETKENDVENLKNDDKILNDLRQSIEKTDNSRTIENNLFDPQIPDKMARRKSHKRRLKKGEDNLTFEPDTEDIHKNVPEPDTGVELDQARPRRRRRPRGDEMETKNEELSRPEPTVEQGYIDADKEGDTKPHRKRRVRKKDHNENIEMQEDPTASGSGIQDPMRIDDDGEILSVMIHRTDRLKTDIHAVHPMIRVQIMDLTTGRLLMKQNRDRRVTTLNEDIEKVTMILPMMTQPFDFKSRRITIPAWEESLLFNENANYLTKNSNVIFFFEVLDLNTPNSVNKSFATQQLSSGFHHIAWGFLLPVGANGVYNTNKKVRLQLYENGPIMNNSDQYSANVFYWWKHNLRKPYPSTLYVSVASIRLNPQTSSLATSRSMFPNQLEGTHRSSLENDIPGLGSSSRPAFSSLQQWKRLPGQICHIPNTPHFKLATCSGGTSAIAFSPDGDWLACGAIDSSDSFPILVYSMTSGSKLPSFTLTGHNRIVHGIAWCPMSQLLASASADGTVRLFVIGSKLPSNGQKTENLSNPEEPNSTITEVLNGINSLRISEKRVLCHPCFVYCAVFHPRSSAILVTAGYDKVIRIWDVAVNRKDILQQLDVHKGYINSVVFSSDGHSMYSGDSQGVIHVWKTPILELSKHSPYKEKWSRDDTIEERDLSGVIINHLMLTPTDKRIVVHARDGNIRLMDLKIKAMVLKFHGIINSDKNIHSCLSPCGSFLFSGTEDYSEGSQAFVWNAMTGDHVAIYKDLNLPGHVNAIDYHPKCHMVAFSSIGGEGSILVYAYSSENARLEIGYQSDNSNPNSPRLSAHPKLNYDNMTKLEETTSRRFAGDELGYNSFQNDYDKRQTDRLSRIINTLNSVTEANQSLRRANRSLDRDASFGKTFSGDGYSSGPEDKGRMMRSNKKATGLQSIPMTLSASTTSKANFTFKPPVAVKHKEQSSKYLGEVVAIYDYDAQRADELSFARGEVIKIVFRDGKNWLLGESSDGTQGYLPTNYVTGDERIADTIETVPEKDTSQTKQEPRNGNSFRPRFQNDGKPIVNFQARFKANDEVVDFEAAEPPMNASLKSSRRQRRRTSLQPTDNT